MDARGELRTLRIVSGGMMASVLFFLSVILFVRPAERSGPELLAYVACGLAVLSLPIASVFRSARWPATTPELDKDYWVKRKVAHMVSLGLLEGPALFCCVALMVSEPWWPLLAMLVPMGGMVAWFPHDE